MHMDFVVVLWEADLYYELFVFLSFEKLTNMLSRSTSKGNNQCVYSRNLHISLIINPTSFFLSYMNVMKQFQIYCKLSWSMRLEHITSHINHKVWTIRINISIRDYNIVLCILYIWLTQLNACVPIDNCTLYANTFVRKQVPPDGKNRVV